MKQIVIKLHAAVLAGRSKASAISCAECEGHSSRTSRLSGLGHCTVAKCAADPFQWFRLDILSSAHCERSQQQCNLLKLRHLAHHLSLSCQLRSTWCRAHAQATNPTEIPAPGISLLLLARFPCRSLCCVLAHTHQHHSAQVYHAVPCRKLC